MLKLEKMKKLTLLFLAGQILLILISWSKLPPQLPLFYSRPWGKEQLTSPLGLFLLPVFSLITFFANFAFSSFFLQEEKLLTTLLEIATFVFNLLSFITLVKIIILVT